MTEHPSRRGACVLALALLGVAGPAVAAPAAPNGAKPAPAAKPAAPAAAAKPAAPAARAPAKAAPAPAAAATEGSDEIPITSTGPVVLKHTPVGSAVRGGDLVVRATILARAGAYMPTLYYRPAGMPTFYSLPMLPVPGAVSIYAAAVPGIFVTKDLEYYLESYDTELSGPGVYGSAKTPLKIPVADPVEQPSLVAVRSDPAEASLLIDGTEVGATPWRGPLAKGPHDLLLKKEGHLDAQSTFDVLPGRDLDLRISLVRASEGAQFAVMSEPAGATVSIDGQELGTTPLLAPCPEGEHVLVIEKKGFARAQRTVQFSKDRSTEMTFTLQPLPPEPALAVTTEPSGALVVVDDKELGKTPFIGVVPSGEHVLVLRLEGRRTAQAQIMMPEDRDLDLRFTLDEAKTARAPVIAVSSEPTGAAVLVDDREAGKTPYLSVLAAGEHKLKLAHPGFLPYEKTLSMPGDHDLEVTLALVPEPPAPGPSKVTIAVEPADAEILIDGRPAGASPATLDLDPGTHTAAAKKDGFRHLEERFRVVQGQGLQLKLALSPVGNAVGEDPGLQVVTEPPGAGVAIDGKAAGTTPFSGSFKPGRHRIVVSLEGFRPREENFDLPGDKTYELRYRFQLEPLRRSVSLASAAEQMKADAEPKKAPVVNPDEVKSASAKARPVAKAPPPAAEPEPAPARAPVVVRAARLQPLPLVLTGAGLVLGGLGALWTLGLEKSINDIVYTDDPTARKSIAGATHQEEVKNTVWLMGGGLFLAAVGAIWAALPGREPAPVPDAAPAKTPHMGVVPMAEGGAVAVGGRF